MVEQTESSDRHSAVEQTQHQQEEETSVGAMAQDQSEEGHQPKKQRREQPERATTPQESERDGPISDGDSTTNTDTLTISMGPHAGPPPPPLGTAQQLDSKKVLAEYNRSIIARRARLIQEERAKGNESECIDALEGFEISEGAVKATPNVAITEANQARLRLAVMTAEGQRPAVKALIAIIMARMLQQGKLEDPGVYDRVGTWLGSEEMSVGWPSAANVLRVAHNEGLLRIKGDKRWLAYNRNQSSSWTPRRVAA